MNLSDPDDLRCTLSCAISVPQSLCPTAGKRHPCQCPEHHGECLLHISLFRHGIQLREDTVEGIQRRGSNVTKHHTWRRHSGPLQVLLVSNVSKAAGTTQLWSNSWRFVLQNASECFRMLQNASECFRMLHSCGCCGKYLTNLLDLVSFSHCLTNRG